ncbi:hypothetical protein [Phenylobacterium sp.]|uniref:hypothetical protein n=1 Tax=Phenylobacterium sp. TaxID=1871053 RepID=UPI00289E6F40|nr:hypothetical protein [Phenylobacterium sp.]
MSTSKTGWFVGAAIASTAMAGMALAQETTPIAPIDPVAASQPAISEAELGAISGGAGVVVEALSNQQLTASNSGSVEANQVVTGNVDFSTGDYSGIGNFVVNTGNNNNLQGVISVNIATGGVP